MKGIFVFVFQEKAWVPWELGWLQFSRDVFVVKNIKKTMKTQIKKLLLPFFFSFHKKHF